jgi:hypothetical protein
MLEEISMAGFDPEIRVGFKKIFDFTRITVFGCGFLLEPETGI